jgi:hypothetical protein
MHPEVPFHARLQEAPADRPQKNARTELCRPLAQTRGHLAFGQECNHPDGREAYDPVFFQFAFGALQFDIFEGRNFCADSIHGRGTSFDVAAQPCFKGSLEVPANWAIHEDTSPAFWRTDREEDAVEIQKQPEISNEVLCRPGSECSLVKSSAKVVLPIRGSTGFFSGGLVLPVCGMDTRRLLFGFTVRRIEVSHLL